MSLIQSIILGIIQGLTEFLPVSSSGHLVLMQKIFGISGDVVAFDLALHFATLAAVCAVMRKEIWALIKRPFSKMSLMILFATIPVVWFGFIFNDYADWLYQSGISVGVSFVFTGVVLWWSDALAYRKAKNKTAQESDFLDAGVVGLAQALAILPAVSRSGMTLAGGLARGFNREYAIKFSFLMSIPTIAGATLLEFFKILSGKESLQLEMIGRFELLAGVLAAGLVGYFSVKYMLKIFTKARLVYFSYYVIILGVLIVLDQLVFHRFFPALF